MNTNKFSDFDNNSHHQFCGPQQIERDLNTLLGILRGAASDGRINELELLELIQWIKNTDHLYTKHPYCELIDCISKAVVDRILTNEESDDILWICEQYLNKGSSYYSAITSGVQKLHGILRGIKADNEINFEELIFLTEWLKTNDYLYNTYPYQDLLVLITRVIDDNIITNEEQEEIISFCESILKNTNIESIIAENGKIDEITEVNIQENSFCITGISEIYPRKQIAEMIELYGGYMIDSISKKLNYLVICDKKNSCWAFVGYGRKIEKVMSLNKLGANIKVIYESDLYETIEQIKK